MTTTAIAAGLVLWQITERFPAKNESGRVILGPDGKPNSITLNGIRIDFSNTDSSVTVSSKTITLTPDVQRAIADAVVKAQLASPKPGQNQPGRPEASGHPTSPKPRSDQLPASLDPAHRTFVVDSDIAAVANGQECALTSGDVITRLTDTPDADQQVNVTVAASKKGDCAHGLTVAVKVDDLQEMYNHFQEQITNGLEELRQKGSGGLPESPKN